MNNRDSVIGGGRHIIDFCDVISLENLLVAWREFRKGKRGKWDVAGFELCLEENLFALHQELIAGMWNPEPYAAFYVQDPKLRLIHKASVRDRVLYQAVYRSLYLSFDKGFIHDSHSSRNGKGTHRGVKRFEEFARKVTANHRTQGFALKCDIRKYFDSIDHQILLLFISQKVTDPKLFELVRKIIESFEVLPGKGLPLGNVTSQLFANVYLNELDQFAKHTLKARYYIRYCDDFVILDRSQEELKMCIKKLQRFLKEEETVATTVFRETVEKPKVKDAPSNLAVVGKYIITPDVLVALRTVKTKPGEELRLAHALDAEAKKGEVYGVKLEGEWLDCGSKIGFLRATVRYGLLHPETGAEFKKFIRDLLL